MISLCLKNALNNKSKSQLLGKNTLDTLLHPKPKQLKISFDKFDINNILDEDIALNNENDIAPKNKIELLNIENANKINNIKLKSKDAFNYSAKSENICGTILPSVYEYSASVVEKTYDGLTKAEIIFEQNKLLIIAIASTFVCINMFESLFVISLLLNSDCFKSSIAFETSSTLN